MKEHDALDLLSGLSQTPAHDLDELECDLRFFSHQRQKVSPLDDEHVAIADGYRIRRAWTAVEQGNFDTYPVVHMKDAPKTEVYISATPGKRWGGIGEPGATMIQPAVTNAIFAATGKRLRSLTIRGQDLTKGA